jgi:hypothetical protein
MSESTVSRREFLKGRFLGRNLALAATTEGAWSQLVDGEDSLPINTAPQQPNWDENMERALQYLSDMSGIEEA